jgi:Putative MetA-pathway of phenol degradation
MVFRFPRGGVRGALMLVLFKALTYAQSPPATTDSNIVTDRPDVTESSIVVPTGSFQIENGITWTTDHRFQTFDLPESLMRFGLATRTEFRIAVPNYFGGISGRDPIGFGDITLGIKEQLGPLPIEFDLSVILAVSLPIGASRVSSHGYDPLLSFHGLKSSKEVGPPGVCRTCFLTRMAASGTPFGSPRSTSRGKSRNRGRLSPSTQVTSRNAGGQRRLLTLARRTGSPRGNRWIFTLNSAYPAQRQAISLRWDIRSASTQYYYCVINNGREER